MRLFDKTLTLLQRSLDVRLQRQNVLAGNLANANTPGYQPRDVRFADAMNQAMSPPTVTPVAVAPSHEGFLPLVSSSSVSEAVPVATGGAASVTSQGTSTEPSLDGNTVDLDRTMVALAQNSLQYGASAKAAQKKLAILRYVASDGNA